LALVLTLLVVGAGVSGAQDTGRATALKARLDEVAAEEDAPQAGTAIDRARTALQQAAASDSEDEASRQLEIAHAAIVLAERQLALRSVRTELIETQRRITVTRERAAAQRRVLDALLKERAALARTGEEQ
jgi:hypothetical protein